MGVRPDLGVHEATELAAHLFQCLVVEAERTEAAGLQPVGDQLGDTAAHRRGVGRDQPGDGRRLEQCVVDAEIARSHDLDLADGDATLQLGEIFAESRLQDQLLEFAVVPGLGPAPHLAQRRDIGRDPGKAVGRELLAFQQSRIDLALGRHQLAHRFAGRGLVTVGGAFCLGTEGEQVVQDQGHMSELG